MLSLPVHQDHGKAFKNLRAQDPPGTVSAQSRVGSSLIRNNGHFDQGLRLDITWWEMDLDLRERKIHYYVHVTST